MHGIQVCRIVELSDDLVILIGASNWGNISNTDKDEVLSADVNASESGEVCVI